MKRKLSARVLSVFLAVLMLVTSLPAAALTAFAADTSVLVTAMNNYKNAMNGTIKTNMLAAYDAYVDAQEILDAVTYGGVTDQNKINNAASALTAATNAMTVWTPYSGTASVTMPNDSSAVPADFAKGILYAANPVISSNITNGTCAFTNAVSASAVFLYDGTEIRMPVMMAFHNDGGFLGSKRKMYASYPTDNGSGSEKDNDMFQLQQKWRGYKEIKQDKNTTGDTAYVWNDAYNATNRQFGGFNYSNQMQNDGDSDQQVSNNGYQWRSYANYMTYIGGDTGFTNGYRSTTMGWFAKGGVNGNNTGQGSWQNTATYHVIDYKTVITTLNSDSVKNQMTSYAAELKNGTYDENGLRNAFVVFDKLTFNPTTVDYASDVANKAKEVAQKFSEGVAEIAKPSTTADSGYDDLRSAIASTKGTFDGGQGDYTTETWDPFVTAYNDAVNVFKNIEGTSYPNSQDAKDKAEALKTAFSNLKDAGKVDVSAVIQEINTFNSYKQYFTSASVAAVEAVINSAISVIWEPDSAYPSPSDVLILNDDNTAIVTAELNKIKEAIKGLRIDMNAKVDTADHGVKSMNEALALKTLFDKEVRPDGSSKYGNPTVFTDAYAIAKAYADASSTTELLSYSQIDDYAATVEALLDAYDNLNYALSDTPNGHIIKHGSNVDMTTLTSVDSNNTQHVGFSYNDGAIIFKTSHDAIDVVYGTAKITFGTNRGKGTGTDVPNNMLDSISINATAPQINGQDQKNHISGTESSNTSAPGAALTDAQYAGCVKIDGQTNSKIPYTIGINNIRYTGTTFNNNADRALTLQDGTSVGFDTAANYDLTTILGTTDGAATNPGRGGLFVRSLYDGKQFAYTYAQGDMYAHLDATTPIGIDKLAASNAPTVHTLKIDGNFGAVSIYNTQAGTAWTSYNYVTSASTGEKITSTVTVVDLTSLVDLLKECEANVIPNQEMYDYPDKTDDSWDQFISAYNAAQEKFDYSQMTGSAIATTYATRYRTLLPKYRALQVKTYDVVFNLKDAQGADTSVTINVEHGKSIADYIDQFNAIATPSYVDGAHTYVFDNFYTADGATLDLNAPIKAGATYNAEYIGTLNVADFSKYDAAQADLRAALEDNINTVDDLKAAATTIAGMTYYDYTDDVKADTMATEQAAIDAETQALIALKNDLVAKRSGLDLSAAEALVKASETFDIDRYNADSLEKFTYTEPVKVDSVKTVSGLLYSFADENALDQAIRDALNNLDVRSYNVYFNNQPIEGKFDYGTVLTIDSTGAIVSGESTAANAAWTYSYNAPSRELNGSGQSNAKYMATAPAYEFIVKGDTYLTADIVDDSADTCTVTVKASTGSIIEIAVVDKGAKYTMPTAPNFAFYSFEGYDNAAAANDKVTINEDTTIIANYEADESNLYTISVGPSWMGLASGRTVTAQYAYDEKVTVKADFTVADGYTGSEEVYCWVIATFNDYLNTMPEPAVYTPVSYSGAEYSFYACSDIEMLDPENLTGKVIIPITYDEYETFVKEGTTVLTESGKYYINGTYTSKDITFIEKDGATDKVVGLDGTPILANEAVCSQNKWTITGVDAAKPTVTALENVVPIYTPDGNTVEKFSMIGNFSAPVGYEVVEYGFLFTSDTSVTADVMNVENVGNNGIARFKASRHTVGNQFVINIKNPARDVSFKYMPYVIVKNASGTATEVYYGNISNTLTNNF